MENLRLALLDMMKKELSPQQIKAWIDPLLIMVDNDTVRLTAPNSTIIQWIKRKFLQKIKSTIHQHLGNETKLVFSIVQPIIQSNNPHPITTSTGASSALPNHSNLNPSFCFDNYVAGHSNQLAINMAHEVVRDIKQFPYNPLFIYGGVGLGKTHLLHAIGNALHKKHGSMKICYAHTMEDYLTNFVKACRYQTVDKFKSFYYSLDILLVDDIQFLTNGERTQDEFFHNFNALVESNRQIIITCDTYPSNISAMNDRLKTRFSSGLIVEIEPPNVEMRTAILLQKAQEKNLDMSNEISLFIAKQLRSNVRELEGAINKIKAMMDFRHVPLSLDTVKEALKDLIPVHNKQITIDRIQKEVADYYKIKLSDMFSSKRQRNIVKPRQIAMFLSRELTNFSFPEIGKLFGDRHHTTVIHACNEIDSLKRSDTSLVRDIALLTQIIRN